MTLDIILLTVAAVILLLGIIGSVAPVLPGPPLCYLALLIAHFTSIIEFSAQFLLFWAVLVIVVVILDYMIPVWGAKKFGGTKAGTWGAGIGLVIGLIIFPTVGIILGPVLGAFAGELIANRNDVKHAVRAAIGALVGFVLSTGLKLAVCFVMTFYFVKEIVVAYT